MAKTRKTKKKNGASGSKALLRFADWAIIIVVGLAGLFIAGKYILPKKEPPHQRRVPDKGAIEVELFGGCGRGSEVMRIAGQLRKMGIDVVNIKKESGYLYPSSLIVDRRGNNIIADSLAKLVGLPRDRIVLQRYDLMVDATIVVGLDYPTIVKKLTRRDI